MCRRTWTLRGPAGVDNLLCWSRKKRRAAKNQAQRLLKELRLAKLREKVSALSGGMKRRVNLAVEMLDDPEVLLLSSRSWASISSSAGR
jgi:ABC-type multidrug transport system ATPase subunit